MKNRAIVTAIIYGTLLLDNILLTVIGNFNELVMQKFKYLTRKYF